MPDRLRRWARLLTFRITERELEHLDRHDLAMGLVGTWLVGMGRYWDDPGAKLLQHLGVGSVLYVFILSLLLWLVIWPLGPRRWSYVRVLTFVALVSPPAALYAFPIERFTSLDASRDINACFLAVVAMWRVALLLYFLRVSACLSVPRTVVGGLLPLTFVVAGLTFLNLERAVFEIMGGLRGVGTSSDRAYRILFAVNVLSFGAFVPLLVAYVIQIATTDRTPRGNVA
jgi:hypothetical protein